MSVDLHFPKSLPEFQKLFPDDAHCAAYLERVRWREGFICPSCETAGDPLRIATRPHVLRCRKCRKEARLTAGTVMQDSHTPLLTWFWGAYLVASMTPGMSAVQFQRQLGLAQGREESHGPAGLRLQYGRDHQGFRVIYRWWSSASTG